MTPLIARRSILPAIHKSKKFINSLFCSSISSSGFAFTSLPAHPPALQNASFFVSICSLCNLINFPKNTHPSSGASSVTQRSLNTHSSEDFKDEEETQYHRYETEEEGDTTDGWEEEEETEPMIDDGGDGGGIVLQNVPWGEQVLSIAREVLLQFGDDMKLFAFKTTPRGYIYVRLDKLSTKYGCPSMEEVESYNQEYKKRLDEVGARGEIPDDLAIEISSPGAYRILKVPDDLTRFKEMPMRVCYIEDAESKQTEKTGFFLLESVDVELENCVWKLANVKENRDPSSKGRPLNRKKRDWRLKLPYAACTKVTLYLG